jgi:hypothetical protein
MTDCPTVEHPYHEGFWVVIGTAAPVFLLASVVAAGPLKRDRSSGSLSRRNLPITALAFCGGSINLSVLTVALQSLAEEHDTANKSLVTYALALSIFLLALGVEGVVTPKKSESGSRQTEQPAKPNEASDAG